MTPPKVLIVDDEPLIATLYARAITAAGFTPVVAHDGEQALEIILEAPPALLISDVNMPGLDGLQMLAWLQTRRLKKFPAFLLSGDDDVLVLTAGLAAGADDFIIKGMPFSAVQARAKFWLSSPFITLPDHVRAQARETFLSMPEQRRPAARLHHVPARITTRVRFVMDDLLAAIPHDFGESEADILRYLGALDGVSYYATAQDGLAQLRLPDIWLETTAALALKFPNLSPDRLAPYFADFATHSQNPTFRHARDTLTIRF
jgi:DNA-binding response OmpR family regulator